MMSALIERFGSQAQTTEERAFKGQLSSSPTFIFRVEEEEQHESYFR